MAKKTKALIITVLAGLLAAALGYFNINVDRQAVEEAIYENMPTYSLEEETLELVQIGTVSRVIDGDTIAVLIDGEDVTVRLIGIDAPETEFAPGGAECFGTQSSEYLRNYLAEQSVLLTSDATQDLYDKYGRLLSYVSLDATDIGLLLLQNGYAKEYTYDAPYEKQLSYQEAELNALQAGAGLWEECN